MNDYRLLYLNDNVTKFAAFNKPNSPFAIIGIPLDITSSFRPGGRFAPNAIRNTAQYIEFYSIRTGIDMGDIGFNDVGDVILHPTDVEENLRRISEIISYFSEKGYRVIGIGGEHTVTIGIISGFLDNPCIISFDAHLDLRDEYLGYKVDHACVMRRILESKRSKLIEVGIRAVSKEEVEFAQKNGIIYFTPSQIKLLGVKEVARKILINIKECSSLYISYDMDVFDPSYAPAVATPEPEGLDPTTVFDLSNLVIENYRGVIKGFDVVELTPIYDTTGITSVLASKLILEIASMIYKYNITTK
jgi:agmatinase